MIENLANEMLKQKVETLTASIKSEISRVEMFAEESLKGSRVVNAWELSDKQMVDFHRGVKESLSKFVTVGGELDRAVKEIGKAIEEGLKAKEKEENEKLEAIRVRGGEGVL